jgi:hypothetical protein
VDREERLDRVWGIHANCETYRGKAFKPGAAATFATAGVPRTEGTLPPLSRLAKQKIHGAGGEPGMSYRMENF